MTLIIGSEGSMGKRYQAILSYFNQPFECHDPAIGFGAYPNKRHDRFIIASPTHTHLYWVKRLDEYKKPILCEKPLSKDLQEVEDILACKSPLSMTFQYGFLATQKGFGPSHYNYFRSGQDGLVWDCFQIIALAKDRVLLDNTSPVWTCAINGSKINISDIDKAYVDVVQNWLNGAYLERDDLLQWHKKVAEFEKKWKSTQALQS